MSTTTRPLGTILEARWEATVESCRVVVARGQAGAAQNKYERAACREIVTLARDVERREVIETVLAFYLLAYHQQRRLKSDRAFRFELVRMVRRLGRMNSGRLANGKLVYRELPPKAVEEMARLLIEAFGAAGVHLARHEEREVERRRLETNELHDALRLVGKAPPDVKLTAPA